MIKPHDIEPDVWATIAGAEAGDGAALRRSIARDPHLARCEYWYTPAIHFAVRGGHLDGVKVLLEAGADPEWNGYHRGSLVAMARYRGYEDVRSSSITLVSSFGSRFRRLKPMNASSGSATVVGSRRFEFRRWIHSRRRTTLASSCVAPLMP